MSKSKNILFIASWYPSEVSPQAGNFIRNHAQALAHDHSISVIHAVSRNQEKPFEVTTQILNDVLEVVVYYKKINSNGLFSKRKKFKSQMAAYDLALETASKEKGNFDLVHVNVTFPAGLYAMQLKKKRNIPYIITEHWTAFLKSDPIKLSGIQKQLIKKIGNNAEAICPVSEDLKKAMMEFGIDSRYHVIPNVVDSQTFSFEPKNKSELKTILHVSNLKDEQKNITGLLSVVKALSQHRDDFKLMLVGNGDIEHYKAVSEKLNIPSRVISFKGEQPPAEIAKMMKGCDCFLLFSNYENLPCVIAEAHCTGTPVLSTDVGGVHEMIDQSNGVLVEPLNEGVLKESLNLLLDNLSDFDNQAIASKAKVRYSPTAIANSYNEVYKTILE